MGRTLLIGTAVLLSMLIVQGVASAPPRSAAQVNSADTGLIGDLNGDCIVDMADFAILRDHFSETCPVATATATTVLLTPSPTLTPLATRTPTATPGAGACPLFPADSIFNARVDSLPVYPSSSTWLAAIAGNLDTPFSAAWYQGYPNGMPWATVGPDQPLSSVTVDQYPAQSDFGLAPIPTWLPLEGPLGTDRHAGFYQQGTCVLYELYHARPQSNGSWLAGSSAKWNLTSNALRPVGWTSTDAAGLPILPLTAKYNEIASGAIYHALRFTAVVGGVRSTYTWPARHSDGTCNNNGCPPMGIRVRLKASVSLSGLGPQARIIAQAMKDYGLILADTDSDSAWGLGGEPNPLWHDSDIRSLQTLDSSDFEVVDVSGIMVDPNSGQVH